MHFYFDSWSADNAVSQMRMAKLDGITKILNSEVGASAEEYRDFSRANVDNLEAFLSQCQTLGITNCVWMNDDATNWPGYIQNDFVFNIANPKPSLAPTLQPTHPPQQPTATLSPVPTSMPIATEKPPSPTATSMPFNDSSDSKPLSESAQSFRFIFIRSSSPMLFL
jgi:hypothetical protein